MIIVFAGFNGSGKTISLVRELVPYDVIFANFMYLGKKGQEIYIDGEVDALFMRLLAFIERSGGVKKMRKSHLKVAFAIDEAGIDFSSRSFKALTKNTAYLFSQHRKLGIDFLMTAQNVQMLDRMLRLNVAITAYCSHFFLFGMQRWYSGISEKKEARLYTVFFWLPAYYKLYDDLEIVESTQFLMDGDMRKLQEQSTERVELPGTK